MGHNGTSRTVCAPSPRAQAIPLPSGRAAHHEPLQSGPPLLLPVRREHDPGVLGGRCSGHSRPHSGPWTGSSRAAGGRRTRLLKLAPLSKGGREREGGPGPSPAPSPPHPYPIASSINLTLEPSRAGLSSHPVGLGLSHQPQCSVEEGVGCPGGRGQDNRGVGEPDK